MKTPSDFNILAHWVVWETLGHTFKIFSFKFCKNTFCKGFTQELHGKMAKKQLKNNFENFYFEALNQKSVSAKSFVLTHFTNF